MIIEKKDLINKIKNKDPEIIIMIINNIIKESYFAGFENGVAYITEVEKNGIFKTV